MPHLALKAQKLFVAEPVSTQLGSTQLGRDINTSIFLWNSHKYTPSHKSKHCTFSWGKQCLLLTYCSVAFTLLLFGRDFNSVAYIVYTHFIGVKSTLPGLIVTRPFSCSHPPVIHFSVCFRHYHLLIAWYVCPQRPNFEYFCSRRKNSFEISF